MYDTPLFTDTEYFVRLPDNQTKERYRHIARVFSKVFQSIIIKKLINESIIKTGDRQFITKGPFDTLQVLAISREELSGIQYLYYASTLPTKPGERHIFKVRITSTRTKTTSECLTCDLGDQCLYNNAIFSHNAKYFVLECNGPAIPKIELKRTEDNFKLLTLQTNDRLADSLSNKLLPIIQKLKVPIEGQMTSEFIPFLLFCSQIITIVFNDCTDLSVMLYMPPDFRKDEIVKYPLLIQVLNISI